ncbi:MAG TPA: PilZ domain-containing protein [Clostridia bacterium]|nr:PilZ domain-containing protein [Clostridia bacterium]
MSTPKAQPTFTRSEHRYKGYTDLKLNYEGSSKQVPVHVPDISPKGMFINTPQFFPIGSVVNVSFRLSGSDFKVETRGEVRYCLEGVGIGIEFVDIAPEAQRAIMDEFSRP